MPASQQSGALKVALPLIAALLFAAFIFGPALFAPKTNQNQQQQQQADADADAEGAAGAEDDAPVETAVDDSEQDEAPAPEEDAAEDVVEAEPAIDEPAPDTTPSADASIAPAPDGIGAPSSWSLRTGDAIADTSVIGSTDAATGYELEVEIDPAGVGIEKATFTNHFDTAVQAQKVRAGVAPEPEWHYEVESTRVGTNGVSSVDLYMVTANAIFVQDPANPQASGYFDLTSEFVWQKTAEGAYEATLLDAQGNAALVITRAYSIDPGSYDIAVAQTVENRTGLDLNAVWYQYGPSDLPPETSGYRIPTRRVRVAFTNDQNAQYVTADRKIRDLSKVVELAGNQQSGFRSVWPDDAYKNAGAFAWVAQTNRHFMFVVHPEIDRDAAQANVDNPQANPIDKSFALGGETVLASGLFATNAAVNKADEFDKHVEIAMQSSPLSIPAGDTLDISFGVYLGPLDDRYLGASNDPRYGALNLADAVIYQIGFCGICTFQWIAKPLLALIRFFQGNVVFDWGIAIILLVICVRALLHPITKKSQVSMMRFGKQMQKLAPKQQKIKERYKDDRQRMNQELAKLMREEQINPLGMLGCLPMLLQSPIWIALYATIYFAFDIRHEPAFFGLFQQFGGWTFLNDLSSPDHFIDFGRTIFTIPLMGAISGFNILPILMGAIFFVQQKYMSPPSSGNMSPEQEQTQKIMKVMIVVMFPVFMYNAPSGLTLYILTSSTLGVIESRYIRSHVDKLDLENPPPKKQPKAGSMRKAVENTAYGRGPEQRNRYKNRKK